MKDVVCDSGKFTLVDMVAMLCQQAKVIILFFIFSLAIAVFLIWSKPVDYNFYSVYEVGARGLDVALEAPDLLVERAQDIYSPRAIAERRERWLESNYPVLQVDILHNARSSLVKLHTRAPLSRHADVHTLHKDLLQVMLSGARKRLTHIEASLVSRRNLLVAVVGPDKNIFSRRELAGKKQELMNVELQLANLSGSIIRIIAEPSFKQAMLGRGELFGFALVLCALLSILAGAVAIFITSVRTRLNSYHSAE